MKWLVIPDMQVPDQDDRALRAVRSFMDWYQPDGFLCVGDELDAPSPSRWNKGYAGEFSGALQKEIDKCHDILATFREDRSRPFMLMRSNHGERIRTYISRYAPALTGLRGLDYEALLGLPELGIVYHEAPYEFAPGWLLAHGDEGSLVQTAAGTAMGLAKKWGMSVVCGHTHKAGIQHQHLTVNGKVTRHLFGMEVGHLMDPKKADYLKAGSANWQSAVAVIEVDGRHVQPTLIPLFGSKIRFAGKEFS